MIKDICVNLCTPLEECIDGIVCTRGVKVNVASPSIIVENMQATITCDTIGVTIKYTLDGSTPSATNGTTYSSAINLTQNCTIKAIAIKGNNVSAVVEYIYTMPVVNTPVITITDTTATITCATNGATIYYTLDGTIPTSSSTKYTSAIALTQSCTIKAIAVKSGMTNSGIAEEEYVKPITYLTQWRMMGNSVVHTDEYLTQWKVEGNSVVDNNAILSCGDLGQDGKYHVKISNGVTIYDIPLTEPLRKVNDVADSIEFADGVATVTRNIASTTWNKLIVTYESVNGYLRYKTGSLSTLIKKPTSVSERVGTCLSADFVQNTACITADYNTNPTDNCMAVSPSGIVYVRNTSNTSTVDFYADYGTHEFYYRLAIPTTEVIQVSPFPISPTDTYTSANDTPYSAFEYKKNVEIWSCGEYSEVDNKWHIRILPEGYGVVDIALDEPLRKVNNVADKIEFSDGVATLTRYVYYVADMRNLPCIRYGGTSQAGKSRYRLTLPKNSSGTANGFLCTRYSYSNTYYNIEGADLSISYRQYLFVYDSVYNGDNDADALSASLQGEELIYELKTPTTEVIQVPQIQEADSYTCVISQGGKAVSWSSFTPNPT